MQFRQGDVFLELIEDASSINLGERVPLDKGRVVLAYGEVTGHAHAISDRGAILFFGKDKAANQDRFLRVLRPVSLLHEEHSKIELPKGLYRVRRQREWTDQDDPIVVAD
jgi:hypothetical protein